MDQTRKRIGDSITLFLYDLLFVTLLLGLSFLLLGYPDYRWRFDTNNVLIIVLLVVAAVSLSNQLFKLTHMAQGRTAYRRWKFSFRKQIHTLRTDRALHHRIAYLSLILFLFFTPAYFILSGDGQNAEPFSAELTVFDSRYTFDFSSSSGIPVKEIGFEITDPEGKIVEVDDPNGNTIQFKGNLVDILMNHSKEQIAGRYLFKNWSNYYFYPDYPTWENNITLYIVFLEWSDRGQEMILDHHDALVLRAERYGGIVDEGYRVRLFHQDGFVRRNLLNVVLPRAPTPFNYELSNISADYVINIQDVTPVTIKGTMIQYQSPTRFFTIKLEEIQSNESDYQTASMSGRHNATYRDLFYANFSSGISNDFTDDEKHRTLYFIYLDENLNGLVDAGDTMHIRSLENGGIVQDTDSFRIIFPYSDLGYITSKQLNLYPLSTAIDWDISVVDECYRITISNITDASMFNTILRITNSTDYMKFYFDGYSDRWIVNDLFRLLFIQDSYNESYNHSAGEETYAERFYVQHFTYYNGAQVWSNLTKYIIFEDVDNDDNVTSGDIIWVRPSIYGGLAEPGDRFMLWNERLEASYGTLVFPELE